MASLIASHGFSYNLSLRRIPRCGPTQCAAQAPQRLGRRRRPRMVPTRELRRRVVVEEKKKGLVMDERFRSPWLRSLDVWTFLVAFRLRVLHDSEEFTYLDGFSEEKHKWRRRRTASWLRREALRLGPTFIKLGQFLSTRSDLLPEEYVQELAKLQDEVPAFSSEDARRLIEEELGATVEVLFREFDDRPIAAASLGQVHRAVLHNGENVVVKVQRPGLKKLFDIDLRNMKLLANYFQHRETSEGSSRNWLAIYDDCSRLLYQEIDYINEGKSADRFRRDFRNVKWVRVPLIYWDYTSRKVLTLEYIPGIKINDVSSIEAMGHSCSQVASRVIESYLVQILKTGFFHADPHPGNVALDEDGSLVYYDFGMMGEIKTFTRERLLELFFAIYENDVKKVARSLVALEVVEHNGDMVSLQRSIQHFMNKLSNQIADRHQTISAVGEDLFATARDQPICFPSTFVYVMKAFTTIEGIGYSLDPQFSFAERATPYIQELLSTREGKLYQVELVGDIRRQANEVRSVALSMPSRIQKIEDFTKQLEAGDLKLHVRVLESERAAQRASLLQMTTIYSVLGGVLLNTGMTLSSQGFESVAHGCFIGCGIFLVTFIASMKKIEKLGKINKMQ